MVRKVFACLFFLFSFVSAFAFQQNNIDSLKKQLSKSNKYQQSIILLQLGDIYFNTNQIESALNYYNQAIDISQKIANDSIRALAMKKTGDIYSYSDIYHYALRHYTNALEIVENNHISSLAPQLYNNIGIIYLQLKYYQLALDNFLTAAKIDSAELPLEYQCEIFNNLGGVYLEKGQLDKAKEFFDKSLENCNQEKNVFKKSYTLHYLGELFAKKEDFKVSNLYFQKSLKLARKYNLQRNIAINYFSLSKNQLAMGNIDSALALSQKSIKKAFIADHRKNILDNYQLLTKIYILKGDSINALKYHKTTLHYRDSVFSKQFQNQIAITQADYNFRKKQRETELMLQRQKFLRNSIIVIMIFVVIISVILYFMYRIKKGANQELEMELEEIKLLESQLSFSRERFDLAMQAANEGLWDWNLISNQVYYSPRWKKILGYEDGEISNHITEWESRIHPDDIIKVKEEEKKHLKGQTQRVETHYRIQHKNGQYIWVYERGTAMLNVNEKPYRMVGILMDITKQKNIEKQLHEYQNELEKKIDIRTRELKKAMIKAQESDSLKSAFLSNLSHELRTPMNAILGFVSLLESESIDREREKDFIQYIRYSSDALLRLINDMVDLSLIETNQLKIIEKKCYFNRLLKDIHAHFTEVKERNDKQRLGFLLNCPIENQNFAILSDEKRLRQIIYHLVDNALKFTDHGYVEMGYELKSKSLIFYVKDTGKGINSAHIDSIFDSFRKGDEQKSILYRGTGLGLTIVKRLVDLLDGKIGVDSEVDAGTKFSVEIPYIKINH